MFFPIICGNVVENFILYDIILFYFIIPMMLWVDMPLGFYVVVEPDYMFWQVEQPILLFILIIMLL